MEATQVYVWQAMHCFTLKLEPIDVNFVDLVDSSEGGKRLETNGHLEAFNKTWCSLTA